MKRFLAYLFRWQLSTIILAPVVAFFANAWIAAIVANLIGGCIFYWVDKWIFNSKELDVQWERRYGKCFDCGKEGRVYRIVKAPNYNKLADPDPEYRCGSCADKKEKEIL
jgi:hypothetical protein